MKKLSLILAALVVVSLLSLSIVAAQEVDRTGWPETFVLGVYPGDNVEEALAAVEPLREYLAEALGIDVELVTGTSYSAVIEAMRAGRADAMEVGPFSYVLAVQEANAEAIAVVNYDDTLTLDNAADQIDPNIIPGYYSLLFTVKGSGIASIADLEGRTLALTDPASTSGYLIPSTTIMTTVGLETPAELEAFVNITIAGNHSAAVLAVANGSTDAGATFDGNLIIQAEEGLIELCGYDAEAGTFPYLEQMTQDEIAAMYEECPDGSIVVFAQSSTIPETPFAVRADLPDSFKDALREALFAIAENPELAVAIQRYYVNPQEALGLEDLDSFYDVLRDTAELLDLDLN